MYNKTLVRMPITESTIIKDIDGDTVGVCVKPRSPMFKDTLIIDKKDVVRYDDGKLPIDTRDIGSVLKPSEAVPGIVDLHIVFYLDNFHLQVE